MVLAAIAASVALLAGPVGAAMATVSINSGPAAVSKDTTPTFGGSADDEVDPVTLNVFEGTNTSEPPVRSRSTEALRGGEAWSLTVAPGLSDGSYTALAEQTNLIALTEPEFSTPREFIVDTTPPNVTVGPITSPTRDATPKLEGKAGTAPGDESPVHVAIHFGSSVGGGVADEETVTQSGGKWSYTPSTLGDGTYTAEATQKDEAGNKGESSGVTFIVDTEAPEVSIDPVTSPTKDASPTVKGGAGTAAGDHESISVKIYHGSSAVGTPASSGGVTQSGGKWSYTPSSLEDGTYTAQATQADDAGNKGESEAVTFVVDAAAPKVTINSVSSPTKDATPTLGGNAGTASGDSATVSVTIYQGSSVGGATAASGNVTQSGGKWSYTPPSLEDGTYTAQATQKDNGANTGESSGVTFIVDTTPPKVTMDSVTSPTKDPSPTLEGGAGTSAGDHAGISVTVYRGSFAGGTIAASATVSRSGGGWSYTPSALEDGTYTAQATQLDDAGNEGESEAVTFIVDAASPKVTINSVSSPTNDSTPTLGGNAGTASGDSATVSVTIYHGSSVGGSTAASGNVTQSGGKWSYTPPSLGDGTYTAQATQKDNGANTGESSGVTFIVDTTPPKVTMKTVSSPTNDATPSLSGAAGTATGDHSTVFVTIYQGGSASGTVATSGSVSVSGGGWTFNSSHLNDGTYTAQATQEDAAENEGASDPVTFTVETSAPEVSLNSVNSPTKDPTPTLTGSAGTTGSDESTVSVIIYHGSTVGGTTAASGSASVISGKWSFTPSSLGDGTYTAQASQKDGAGNIGKSSAVTFIVDVTPPKVTMNGVSSPTKDSTPTLEGGAGTAAGDHQTVSLTIYRGSSAGGSTAASGSVTQSGGKWSYTPSSLEDGTYTAQATQIDDAGNEGESEAVTFIVDAVAPKPTINSVSSPTNDPTPTLGGNAGTASGDSATVSVTIYHGSSVGGATAASGNVTQSGGKWSYTPASLEDGTYTAQATQKDNGANTGESSAVTFIVDTAAPSVSLNTITSPTGDATPTLSGNGGSATGDHGTVLVTIFSGESQVASGSASIVSGHWSFESPHLSDGTYTAKATQTDQAGNTGNSATRTFTVETTPPTLTLKQPTSPSKDTTPSFTGTASDTEPVTVHIFKGSKAEGTQVSSASASGSGGAFSSGEASPALASGQYTAIATQKSSLGNPEGKSNTVSFEVDTSSPTVTLNPIESPSNNTTPSFSGFGSDKTQVTVQIFKGTKAEGLAVSKATATGTGAEWSSGQAGPALTNGQYTAIATQPSALGNPDGVSNTVTFTINTSPPAVTLNQPKTPSNDTTPSFTGTGSDVEPITIRIYSGSKAEGTEVAKAAATGTGTGWSSGPASPPLTSGTYTAIAEQPSSLGNATGKSSAMTFVVDTSSPTVTLGQPPTPSNVTAPSFKGTASATTQVVIHIYEGQKAEGIEVSKATATGTGGSWTSGGASPALASGTHTYTAVATQESPLGNPAGRSSTVTFVVNTTPPTVTLGSLPVRSNNATPSFKGTASDTEQVIVRVYEGSKAEGTPVSTLTAAVSGGNWEVKAVTPFANGEYIARAGQKSSLGNAEGMSAPVPFAINTLSPSVIVDQPQTPSNVTTPSFTGTASDTEPVTVRVYKGPKAEGTPVAALSTTLVGKAWKSQSVGTALVNGEYTVIANQKSSFGNPEAISNAPTFIVNTLPPNVKLAPLAKPLSNNTTPKFGGTASDTEPVVVHVYEEPKPGELKEVSKGSAPVAAGAFTEAAPTPALPQGLHTYVAIATQKSSIGNQEGKSLPVTFEVDTTSPTVKITSPLPDSKSNKLTPEFNGTSSGTHASAEVSIKIYEGKPAEARNVSSAKATIAGGKWTTGPAIPALAIGTHTYTAVATQESLLGNPAGTSEVTFTVNTEPPAVTLKQPPSPSNSRTPSFEGTASDTTQVIVRVYEGKRPEGKEVSSALATPVAGAWTSGPATLPTGKHTYTAIAIQESSLGNAAGKSTAVTFIVDPEAPTVTLNAPQAQSNDTTPSFSGSASNSTQVTVRIYQGARAEGAAVSSATAGGNGGSWSSGKASPALSDGQYTAQAEQASVLGEHVGRSREVTFTVDTVSPQVSVTEPANGSSTSGGSQPVKGTAGTAGHDIARVTAQLFSGSTINEGQSPVQAIDVNAVAGAWSTTFGGLAPGTYTVRALQHDEAGNVGVSATKTFVVNPPAAAAVAVKPPGAPVASFSWFPSAPRVGESVSLVSSSTDAGSPIVSFAWDVAGTGAFAAGGSGMSTTFSTQGNHVVQLRVTDANGVSAVSTQTIPVGAAPLTLMQPFPVVRITSSATRSGVRLTLLGVLASPGSRITVQCKGRACPAKAQSHIAAAHKPRTLFVEFRRFQRPLAAGVTLEIRVSKPGAIGKYTRFVVRRGKRPVRFDACLAGTAVKPIGCPTS
jgi:major membrane immunogen (membrane-anchored lipoprotein)